MPKAIRVEKVCDNCGETFFIKPSHSHQRFCTRACLKAHEMTHGRPAAKVAESVFSCKTCGHPFRYKPAYLTEYRKKFGKDPLYCSVPCSAKGRRADTMARSTFVCEQCGKINQMRRYEGTGRTVYYRQQRFCDQTCKVAWQMAEAARRFTEEPRKRHVKQNGYVWISIPANLNNGKKREIMEHRWVMSQHLGRDLLPEETVHHIDGNRQNNALSNLELFCSRHGPGQRVVDMIAFAIEMLRTYPEFAAEAGIKLVDIKRGG